MEAGTVTYIRIIQDADIAGNVVLRQSGWVYPVFVLGWWRSCMNPKFMTCPVGPNIRDGHFPRISLQVRAMKLS